MSNASTAGLRVLRQILDLDPKQAGLALGRLKRFLTYPDEGKAFDFIRGHFSQYGKLPHPDTVLEQASVYLPTSNENLEFEIAVLENRFVEDAMRTATEKASALIMEGDAKAALKSMLGDILPVTQEHGGYALTDLRHTLAVEVYKEALAGKAPPVELIGYPSLDAQGGIEDGDMIGVIGKPGSGKTWLMLNTALQHWALSEVKEPHMFVTQEMSAPQIEKRALPLIAGVDPTPLFKNQPMQYKLGATDAEGYVAALEAAKAQLMDVDAPFLIYDAKMAGTVADIEAIAALHGVRRVWIDGAYMLRHPDPRLGRYARVPENLDLLKQWQQRTGTASFTSWQFKRGSGKENEETEPDLDDIGYSHAIGEYCGVILGLLENPKKLQEQARKKVTVMKGRNGESGSFYINWDFSKCDFSEWQAEEHDAGGLNFL